MSKIDWASLAPKKAANAKPTLREAFAKAHEDLRKAETAAANRAETEPRLRAALLKALISKAPLRVLIPIQNPTEGIAKSQDDDGFYGSNHQSEAPPKFEEMIEVIPAGTSLVFKALDTQLGQLIFKSIQTEREYAVYQQNDIIFRGSAMQNPGFYGLLYNTDLINGLE